MSLEYANLSVPLHEWTRVRLSSEHLVFYGNTISYVLRSDILEWCIETFWYIPWFEYQNSINTDDHIVSIAFIDSEEALFFKLTWC